MKLSKLTLIAFAILAFLGMGYYAHGQGSVTTPPSGGNQKSSITQHIGLASITIDYSSPDVDGREGKIWGELVPYGLNNLGFGPATAAPWRAGANENTTITLSHDMKVQGKDLKAGTYGLHMIAEENEDWTIIFSNNSSSWGSFYYQEDEDALRVSAKPETADSREWLAYDFVDRKPTQATVVMHWEKVKVPFTFEVPNMTELYIANMRNELRSTAGFSWQGFNAAANYCLQNNTNLEEALEWIESGISAPFIGQANFQTLQTKSLLQYALKKDAEAKETMLAALEHAAQPFQKYQFGANLIQNNRNQEAFEYFQKVYDMDPDNWMSHAGIAAGYRVTGKTEKALKHYNKALAGAPDQWKPSLQQRIDSLSETQSAKN